MPSIVETTITAGEWAAKQADKPMFVPTNLLYDRLAEPVWSEGGTWASPTQNDPTYPTSALYDGHLHRFTRPLSSTLSFTYLLLDLNPGTDLAHQLDTLAILGHNFKSYSIGTVSISLTLSNASDFTAPVIDKEYLLDTDFFSKGKRAIIMDLREVQDGAPDPLFHTVRYARLKITYSQPGAMSPLPEIGELVLGRRIQMSYKSIHPYSDDDFDSNVGEFWSETGVYASYVRSKGQAVFAPTLQTGTSSLTYGINDQTSVLNLAKETSRFTRPFLYIPSPFSKRDGGIEAVATADAYWCRHQPEFRFPISDFGVRDIQLGFKELAPFVSSEA